ncbi:MAG TPA: hypothetical protein VH277_04385 [Gemmatimonadaceae bacterium]|nr:hypothetical protein [Gemmatimonadaceae bacterium]
MTASLRSAFALAVLSSTASMAQARVVSAPPDPSLLGITRDWSAASTLGDLRTLRTGSDYLELRVWGGYRLTMPTQGLVLRRDGGHWTALLARVLRCEMPIPRSVGDTASRATMQRYLVETRHHCEAPVKDVAAGSQILTTDSLDVTRLDVPDSATASAWDAAVHAGAFDLPGRIERNRALDDNFMYVVELRRGSEYRASVIEQVEPAETDADRRIRAVYEAVSRVLQPSQRLTVPPSS